MPQVHVGPLQAAPGRQLRNPAEPGWTEFKKTTSGTNQTQVIYVSNSSPNDNYCGFKDIFVTGSPVCPGPGGHTAISGHGPKKTINAGVSLLRSGFPDWLLLRCGDTWSEGFPNWNKSGKGLTEKLLVSSYQTSASGNARPKLLIGNGGNAPIGGNQSSSHVAIVNLDLESTSFPSTLSAVALYGASNDWLIEGCRFHRFNYNIILDSGPHTDIVIRRNVIQYGYVNGMYAAHVDGLLIQENIFYANSLENTPNVVNRHHTYVDREGTSNVVFENNLLSGAYSLGLQCRSGGTMTGNVVSNCGASLQVGHGEEETPVNFTVTRNALLNGKTTAGVYEGPWGMRLDQFALGAVTDNILANSLSGNGRAVQINHPFSSTQGVLQFHRNIIYNWKSWNDQPNGGYNEGAIGQYHNAAGYSSIEIYDCDIQQYFDSSHLIGLNDSGLLPTKVKTSSATTSGCRFWSALANNNAWFYYGGTHSLAEFKTAQDPDDTKSSAVPVVYPNPNAATLAGYSASIGGTADEDAFMAKAILLRKGNWQLAYTANNVNAWIRQQFGK